MDKVGKSSFKYNNVYILNYSSVCGPKEKEGPLQKGYDEYTKDLRTSKSYEDKEIEMLKRSIEIVLKKNDSVVDDISFFCGGDLNNQIAISNYCLRDYCVPFIGVYAACSTLTLSFLSCANIIENISDNTKAIAFTSSSNATAERQFRYPSEYGCQRQDSMTSTVTGACSFIIANEFAPIKITSSTIGRVMDAKMKDSNDMGRCMAISAYDTIKTHFQDFNTNVDDYDLILTGDLSFYGEKMLRELFLTDNIDLGNKHLDSGLLIYDREKQNVFAGGSGSSCIALALASFILPKMKKKIYKKVMVCATGALMNPIMLAQKETIPSICHLVTLEVAE